MGGGGQQQKKQKTKSGGGKRRRKSEKERAATAEELVMKWAGAERLTPSLFDLHAHSTFSDGLLSPELLVARAFRNGVRACVRAFSPSSSLDFHSSALLFFVASKEFFM